ncbi:demethylspheroidene O-methyltransferase [Yoonia maricola]|uniref:Demethylspheroidene O-methyltransferase n=1 Tax=Yoonia maricola TaxID=420999 RepID=A0A2M8W579_9RHOB|nr:methyltransferase [Yoonia maricola]PJI86069.1 demethylspheroidene O-methyltransferase [Yoonia maricola]
MKDIDIPLPKPALPRGAAKRSGYLTRLVASQGFQAWAARFPLTRRLVRSEGEAMFDLVAGFCHSQILQAVVRLQIPQLLLERELSADALALEVDIPQERLQVLLAAATSLQLIKQRRSGRFALTTRGAALAGVPGLPGMIAHHYVLYRDLADPVAFFRGDVDTELAAFWPYVFGAGGATDPTTTATYSQLMADSQVLVAEDTLAAVKLSDSRHILDIGGGTGAFLAAVGAAHPHLQMTLFDLPAVAPAAATRFKNANLTERTRIVPGSFRDDPLPQGADIVSLVRVLYDHADETVIALLRSVHDALPIGGRVLISEPMTGGDAPQRAGDAYFALYCMAMRTGCARSQVQIAALLAQAGFGHIQTPKSRRSFITAVVEGVRQS